MKRFILTLIAICFLGLGKAQFIKNVINNAKNKVEQKTNEKVNQQIDKAVDGSGKKKTNGKDSSAVSQASGSSSASSGNPASADATQQQATTLKSYSKYDFIPGDKVLVIEDFSQDAIGDFPDKWNTNGSGETVTVEGQTGHWLMINKKGRFIPEFITELPENFTFEFEVICNEKFNYYSNPLQIFFLTGSGGKEALEYSFIQIDKRSGVKFGIHPTNGANNGGTAYVETFEDGNKVIGNELATTQFNSAAAGKNKVKISIWRQKQRVRMYLNEEKVFDLPRAFAADKNYSMLMFEIWSGMNQVQDRYLISNLKLAVGAADTRNKLITEGKFVTHGILFDVNSDKIKPESYGALKDIAGVLKENSGIKVKIVGHTDSDGSDADNLLLSKKRAEGVKATLTTEFGIDASSMETDGKGESQPIDKNDNPVGKANNRRVEFIKM